MKEAKTVIGNQLSVDILSGAMIFIICENLCQSVAKIKHPISQNKPNFLGTRTSRPHLKATETVAFPVLPQNPVFRPILPLWHIGSRLPKTTNHFNTITYSRMLKTGTLIAIIDSSNDGNNILTFMAR